MLRIVCWLAGHVWRRVNAPEQCVCWRCARCDKLVWDRN